MNIECIRDRQGIDLDSITFKPDDVPSRTNTRRVTAPIGALTVAARGSHGQATMSLGGHGRLVPEPVQTDA